MSEQLDVNIWKRVPWRVIPHARNFRTDTTQRMAFAIICEPRRGVYISIAGELDECAADYIAFLHNISLPEPRNSVARMIGQTNVECD